MNARPKIEPAYDAPFSVAVNDLTGFEYVGIQKKFGQPFEQLSGAERAMGVYWALINRTESTPWSKIEKMPMYELVGYFQPEPEAGDDPKDDNEKTKP